MKGILNVLAATAPGAAGPAPPGADDIAGAGFAPGSENGKPWPGLAPGNPNGPGEPGLPARPCKGPCNGPGIWPLASEFMKPGHPICIAMLATNPAMPGESPVFPDSCDAIEATVAPGFTSIGQMD